MNKFIKVLPILAALFWTNLSFSQDTAKVVKLKFTGFVNLQSFFDSRQVVNAREAMLLLYPQNVLPDSNGKDINAHPSFNQLAMTSRLTANLTGPDAFKAKTTAMMEGDFTGASNFDNNSFRLRHAYIKLSWKKRELLFGQWWHPLNLPEMIPSAIGLSTGAPFHPFSRQPQIRFVQNSKIGNFVLTASSQRDYSNLGPLDPANSNSVYLRDAIIPNLHFQFQKKIKNDYFGFAADYKKLHPRLKSLQGYIDQSEIGSLALTIFNRFESKKFDLKFQALWGQNLYDHIMLGGYVERSLDSATGIITYTNLAVGTGWIDFTWKGNHFKPGIFAGYCQNLGSMEVITGKVYARGSDIRHLYRISPRINYKDGPVQFSVETEYNRVAYGTRNNKGIVEIKNNVGMVRVLFGAFYYF